MERKGALLLLVLLVAAQVVAEEAASRFEGKLRPCAVGGSAEQGMCGDLIVWENRAAQQGRKIPIHIMVLPALHPNAAPDPVFYFEGGPGDPGTRSAAEIEDYLKELRGERDLVFFDQRGTGGSNALACDLPGSEDDLQGYLRDLFPADSVRACLRQLQSKADLRQYTTTVAVDDVDDVRQWLGYDRINLFGISYGTLAASIYLRQHEDHVRSAVLIAVAPVNSRAPLHFARSAQSSLDRVFDQCSADRECRASFPVIRDDFRKVMQRLDKGPVRGSIANTKTGRQVELSLSKSVFTAALRSMLYDADQYVKAPLYIHLAAQGKFEPMIQQSLDYMKGTPSWCLGEYLSATCAEDTLLIDPSQVLSEIQGTFLGEERIRQQSEACALWPRAELPKNYWDPVQSSTPVLILSGFMDPVTPPEEAAEVARHLPNSLHLVSRDAAHGPFGLENESCEWKIVNDFFRSGAPFDLDTACIHQMRHKPFLLQLAQ